MAPLAVIGEPRVAWMWLKEPGPLLNGATPLARLKRDEVNLGSHRGKQVRKAIRAAGAKLLFLPKYSPDLNPIEQVFSKLKHGLRKAQARSYDGLLAATAELLDTYKPDECRNYFANSGYRLV